METLIIKKKCDFRVNAGHPWVFSNELESVPPLESGLIVEVKNARGRSYGLAFYNPNSLISVRLLGTEKEINSEFFGGKIKEAFDYRERVLPGAEIYRLVFGESDFLPGLIVDKYGDYLSLQILSAGMEKNIEHIIEALIAELSGIKGIYGKNNSKLRELEGLELREEILYGEIPDEFPAVENGVKLLISLREGQKTGYFLDQKLNRAFISTISKNLSVLDCFCNQGGFALHSSLGGSRRALGIDVSGAAIERARRNSEYNGFKNIAFEQADAGEFLQSEAAAGNKWDIVILDPPAFAKNKKAIPAAKIGYRQINKTAMKLIPSGGFLVSSSCSQAIREDVFLDIVYGEALRQNRRLRLTYRGMQSPCHPVLSCMPETQYLKFFIFQVF